HATGVRSFGQKPGAQARHGVHGGQHEQAAQRVVEQVEADHQAGVVQRQANDPLHQHVEHRHDQQQTDDFVQQAAQGYAAAGGGLQAAVEQGQHAAADVGADHQAD